MSDKTGIEWTDATWNPIRGCSRVSEGCRNCYAEGIAARFSGPGQPYAGLARMTPSGPRWTGEVRFIEKHLTDPLRWKKPRRIFVNSMSDLFHEKLADETIDRIFAVMAMAPGHQFQVLTKRPERMASYLASPHLPDRLRRWAHAAAAEHGPAAAHIRAVRLEDQWGEGLSWPLPNVWVGTSVENQEAANDRIPHLLRTPAAVRFLSCEPLLGHIGLRPWDDYSDNGHGRRWLGLDRVSWVIVGGESGPHARPMHPEWPRYIRDQCAAAGVPFFFKQWGEFAPLMHEAGAHPTGWLHVFPDGRKVGRVGKKYAGRQIDGRMHNDFPVPLAVAP